jgi:hypothetical protein
MKLMKCCFIIFLNMCCFQNDHFVVLRCIGYCQCFTKYLNVSSKFPLSLLITDITFTLTFDKCCVSASKPLCFNVFSTYCFAVSLSRKYVPFLSGIMLSGSLICIVLPLFVGSVIYTGWFSIICRDWVYDVVHLKPSQERPVEIRSQPIC